MGEGVSICVRKIWEVQRKIKNKSANAEGGDGRICVRKYRNFKQKSVGEGVEFGSGDIEMFSRIHGEG